MPKIKAHKTVEQIAKKHRLETSFIQKQLDMGEPIEHEHTQDHELAMDIALQHLDEIPDYYTRLKKMEASAKKEHKKFKDVKEENSSDGNLKYEWDTPIHPEKIRYCIKCGKDETREDCQYGTRYWDLFSLPSKLKEETKKKGSLHKWFQDSESTDKTPGWVEVISGEPCAREEGEEDETPKCVSSDKRASMTKSERISAQRRKSATDPNQPEKSGAAKPTYVSTDSPKKKMKEEMDVQEAKDKPGKGSGKKDACYHKVKSRYSVWPSAYASGALVKCRQVGAANWGTKSEEIMHEEERYCPLCDKRETRSECSYGGKAWDKVSVKDEEYSMARSELKTIEDAVKRLKAKIGRGEGDLEAWVQSKITKAADYIDTAADYVNSGEMEEEISFKVNEKKPLTSPQRKVHKMSPKQRGQLPPEMVGKLIGLTDLPPMDLNKKESISIVDKILEECGCSHSNKKSKSKKIIVPEQTIEDANGNTFAEVVDLIKPEPIKGFKSQVSEATRLQAQTGNVIAVVLSWRGKYYSLKMFFPQVKTPSRKEINDEIQKVYPGSVVVYHSISEIQPGQPLIQMVGPQGGSYAKPGPNKNYVKPMGEEVDLKEEGPSLSVGRGEKLPVSRGGGLTKKGRDKYNRATGSNLQAPVTGDVEPGSKAAKRRKAFCSRSRSWKGERGLAARRRWKC